MAYDNIGQAIIIVGSIYLHFAYGLDTVLTVVLCVVALALTVFPSGETRKLQEALIRAQTEYWKAKTEKLRNS